MELADALTFLGLDPASSTAWRLYRGLAERHGRPPLPADWQALAAALACSVVPGEAAAPWPAWDRAGPPLVLGVAGGQGSGKTTLARALEGALILAGANAAACSIDDFYLPRSERQALAGAVHPLLATRGVPGTHDMALLDRVITALGGTGRVDLPSFDKAADDRLPADAWRPVRAPLDVLVLEGWCLGAHPQAAADLADPVNALEAEEDPSGAWRRYVNAALEGAYADLWRRLHGLVYLAVPDMDAVRRWRTEQEQAHPPGQRMDAAGISRFVAHYERLTRWMLADLPGRASLTVRLDPSHRVAGLVGAR